MTEAGAADGPRAPEPARVAGLGPPVPDRVEGAERLGARLLAYDRPGYGGSTPHPGRSVADAAHDVAAILDALGAERFATYGWSGGGPHALACAALLEGRCVAAATIAGVAPSDQPDLEFTAGMGEGNVEEFGKAREGREPLAAMLRAEAEGLASVTPDQLAEAISPHLSGPDAAALRGELAEHLHGDDPRRPRARHRRLARRRPRVREAVGLRRRRRSPSPVSVWQGGDDLMVPGAHGRWLAAHVAGAESQLLPEEGHLTLFANRIGDIQEWLAAHLR